MRKHEIILLLSGVLLLSSLPFLEGFGLMVWFAAKVFYFTGIILMLKNK